MYALTFTSCLSLFVAIQNQEVYILPPTGGRKDEYGFGRGEKGMLAWVEWALNNGSAGNGPLLVEGDVGMLDVPKITSIHSR